MWLFRFFAKWIHTGKSFLLRLRVERREREMLVEAAVLPCGAVTQDGVVAAQGI